MRRSESNPIAADVRRARASRRLPPGAACALCGETDVMVLGRRRVPKSLLELHHVFGRQNDPGAKVVLCLNCHTKASTAQRDAGVFESTEKASDLERLSRGQRSMASFFDLVAEALIRQAEQLDATVGDLDRRFPEWKEIQEDE
jgi:hypothetical protein